MGVFFRLFCVPRSFFKLPKFHGPPGLIFVQKGSIFGVYPVYEKNTLVKYLGDEEGFNPRLKGNYDKYVITEIINWLTRYLKLSKTICFLTKNVFPHEYDRSKD